MGPTSIRPLWRFSRSAQSNNATSDDVHELTEMWETELCWLVTALLSNSSDDEQVRFESTNCLHGGVACSICRSLWGNIAH